MIFSESLPLRSLVASLSLAVKLTRNTAVSAASKTARLRTSLEVAKESIRRLWSLTNNVAYESSAGAGTGIHVVGANYGGGSAGEGAEFKPFFRQKFDPKESTITVFITVCETKMQRATDEKKRDYILNCLGATAQELIFPELPTIQTWAQMRALLITEFGGELSLEVKKDAFVHIAFKYKETLVELANQFYVEGQQLMTSQQITINEAFSACSAELKIIPCCVFNSSHRKPA